MAEIFVGRQPIFDSQMKVFAYELLFRDAADSSSANFIDGDVATSEVILNAFVNIGLNKVVGGHKAFINLTRAYISNPDLILVPSRQIVLEVLEDIEPDREIVNALKLFKQKGHIVSLDDFVFAPKYEPFLELADIIKLDVMTLSNDEIIEHIKLLKPYHVKLLAEKVESHEKFEFLKNLNIDYFQGYFFSKPNIIKSKVISSNRLTVLQLIAKINSPEANVNDLSKIISKDLSLSHRVFRFINSPLTGLRVEVDSIQQAVVMLGISMIKNWVTIMALATASSKPNELSKIALIRGRCCELLAKGSKQPKVDRFFTVGLFSSLDAMMDQPLEDIIAELPLSDEIRDAILEQTGVYGEALRCTLAMEHSDHNLVSFQDLTFQELADIYLEAIHWADGLSENF